MSGTLCLMLGLVLAVVAGYQWWWTGRETAHAQEQLRREWLSSVPPAPAGSPQTRSPRIVAGGLTAPLPGDAQAILYVPRLGKDSSWVVVEGIRDQDLAKGPGHYPGTALPGEVGNFAVAGHRATHGEPFAHLDSVRSGDPIIVETRAAWFVYRIRTYEVVTPDRWDVVAPVPGRPGQRPTSAAITLTTCDPRWDSTHRMVLSGNLVSRRDHGRPPAEVAGMRRD